MRQYLSFFLFLFLNCQSQVASRNIMHEEKEIYFEDKNHYPFSITTEDFLIINSQAKMDEVFRLIHQNNKGSRFSPIPAIVNNETYIIIKPRLKNGNDVLIDKISLTGNTLYIKVTGFYNPDLSKTSGSSPNILLKLIGNIMFKKIIFKY